MNHLSKYRRVVAILGISIYFLFFYAAFVKATPSKVPDVLFNGEQLFEGIFFAKGPVAEQLPEIKRIVEGKTSSLSKTQLADLTAKQILIKELIKKEHPTAFDDFKANINTHNYAIVQRSIDEMIKMIIEASYNLTDKKISKDEYIKIHYSKSMSSQTLTVDHCIIVICSLVVDTEIQVALIAAVTSVKLLTKAESDLQKEVIVNAIISNL